VQARIRRTTASSSTRANAAGGTGRMVAGVIGVDVLLKFRFSVVMVG